MKPIIYQHARSGLWICEGTDIKWAPIVRYCSGLTAEIAFEKWSNSSGIKEASSEAIELAWEMEKLRRKNKDAMLLERTSMVNSLQAVREIGVSKMFPDANDVTEGRKREKAEESVAVAKPRGPRRSWSTVNQITSKPTRRGVMGESTEFDSLSILQDTAGPMLWEECHVLH